MRVGWQLLAVLVAAVAMVPPLPAAGYNASCELRDPDETEAPRRQGAPALPLGPTVTGRRHQLRNCSIRVLARANTRPLSIDGEARFQRACEVVGLNCTLVSHSLADLETRAFMQAAASAVAPACLLVMWIEEPGSTLILEGEAELSRQIQLTLAETKVPLPGTSVNGSDRSSSTATWKPMPARVLAMGSRRCRDMCGGEKNWPIVPAGVTYGTNYLEPRVIVGPVAAMLQVSLSLPNTTVRVPVPLKNIKGPTEFEIGVMQHAVTLYRNDSIRRNLGISIDSRSNILQSLHAYANDLSDDEFRVSFFFRGKNDTRVFSKYTSSYPPVIYAGGNEDLLNQIGNYCPLMWTPHNFTSAVELPPRRSPIRSTPCPTSAPFPMLTVVFLIEAQSPFLDFTLEALANQSYPKDRMSVIISLPAFAATTLRTVYNRSVSEWASHHRSQYNELNIRSDLNASAAAVDVLKAHDLRQDVQDRLLLLSSLAMLNNSVTLEYLVRNNRSAVAPLLVRPGKWFSNFWGSLTGGQFSQCFDEEPDCLGYVKSNYCREGDFVDWMKVHCSLSCGHCAVPSELPKDIQYKRAADYYSIVGRERVGVWNVPLANSALMLNGGGIQAAVAGLAADSAAGLFDEEHVEDMSSWHFLIKVSAWVRGAGGHVLISNIIEAGYLIDPTNFDPRRRHPELVLLPECESLWRRRYLHPAYDLHSASAHGTESQKCWDVYRFPLFNHRFCDELAAELAGLETRLQLSNLYPTATPVNTDLRATTLAQLDFQSTWKYAIQSIVAPVVQSIFAGYTVHGLHSLDFVVQYNQGEDPVMWHHRNTSAAFGINVALNQYGVDFDGGGTLFSRQNCTISTLDKGFALIHPAGLTHQHEWLPVSNGTRRLIVSFVDQY